jgi:hypothetical protein
VSATATARARSLSLIYWQEKPEQARQRADCLAWARRYTVVLANHYRATVLLFIIQTPVSNFTIAYYILLTVIHVFLSYINLEHHSNHLSKVDPLPGKRMCSF